jgi:hypothetical protein
MSTRRVVYYRNGKLSMVPHRETEGQTVAPQDVNCNGLNTEFTANYI